MENIENKKSSRDWGIIQKKGNDGKTIWYARIVRVDGQGKKKQYTSKADSKSHARRLRDELSEKHSDFGERAIDGARMSFRELGENYASRKIIPAKYHQDRKIAGLRSYKHYLGLLRTLLTHFGTKRIKDITPADVERFKQTRLNTPVVIKTKNKDKTFSNVSRQRAIASVNRELTLFRTILNDAVHNGWLTRSPFSNARGLVSSADENKRERVLTQDEEQRLLKVCSEDQIINYTWKGKNLTSRIKNKRKHLRPLLITALDTAMRRGELLKLVWKDVNFINRTISILAMNTKTATARDVGMTPRVFAQLTNLWEMSPKDLDELVFGIKDTIKRSFASACRDAEIENFKFHDCRHTAITRMIQAGLSAMEIMKISGHTQMNTFARYVNPNTQAITRIADVLSAFNAESIIQQTNEVNEFIN